MLLFGLRPPHSDGHDEVKGVARLLVQLANEEREGVLANVHDLLDRHYVVVV